MFLTFLSASLVALGFIYQGGTAQSSDFLVIAVALLALDLMIGLVTLGRIWAASAEEFRLIQGMNRVRHAWLEMVPSLEPYFSTAGTTTCRACWRSLEPPGDDPGSSRRFTV